MSRAFTLIELMVVLGVIALLTSMLVPVVSKARVGAQRTVAAACMKQLTQAYLQYAHDNDGGLLLGYPPAVVNGVTVTATLRDGTTVGPPTSQRYPWRLIPYLSNVWECLYRANPVPMDDYMKGLVPEFGLNSVFLGGHDSGFFRGYVGDQPNTSQHVMFRLNQIRRPSRQIVFCESRSNINGISGPYDGAFYVQPPRGNAPGPAARWWIASPDGRVALPRTAVFGGVPQGRYGNGVLVAFLDGAVLPLSIRELEDSRLWNSRVTAHDDEFARLFRIP